MRTAASRLAALAAAALMMVGGVAAAQDPAHPNLMGIWKVTRPVTAAKTIDGRIPPLLPPARAVYAKHLAMAAKGDRSFDGVSDCLPPGMPHIQLIAKPIEILQKPTAIFFNYQENRLPRRVYLNEQHPADWDVSYLGDSVGHWDDDTLVVDTTTMNDRSVLDPSGLPHSDKLHVVERFRLTKAGRLENRITVDDPKTYARPWTMVVRYDRMPAGYRLQEEVCRAGALESEAPPPLAAKGKPGH